jgi:hypothetical protein
MSFDARTETLGESDGGQDVGRSRPADRYNRVPGTNSAKQKLEGPGLVASALRRIEVIPLDPHIPANPGVLDAMDGRRERTKFGPRKYSKTRKTVKKGKIVPGSGDSRPSRFLFGRH